jgi:hypothetical protein
VIQALLDKDADVNARDAHNRTALICALQQDASLQVIQALLDKDADVNARDAHNRTALIWALQQDASLQVIQALLNKGADVNARDANNDTALIWAIKKSAALSVIETLFDAGADISLIQDPIIQGRASELLEKIVQQRLQDWSVMLLHDYNGKYSSIVNNSDPGAVIRKFLDLKPYDEKGKEAVNQRPEPGSPR